MIIRAIYPLLFFFLLLDVVFSSPPGPRPLVGINYFAGWWRGPGDKWKEPWNTTVDWRPLYPERVPLNGQYITQSTVDQDIIAASSNGVDFFQILWYDNYPTERNTGSKNINLGLSLYLSSNEANRMNFCIEWCNAQPIFEVHSDAEWNEMIQKDWLPAFRHPAYLRVGGKLVFKVHNAPDFYKNSTDFVTGRLDHLRNVVRQAGLGEMLLGGGADIRDFDNPVRKFWGYKYDFINFYAGIAHLGPDFVGKVLPWKNESDYVQQMRRAHARVSAAQDLPYVPHVMSGWDPRPWREKRVSYVFPTELQWRMELQRMASDLRDFNRTMGFPLESGQIQPAFTIYAWNEFGEGGIMAPTKGWNSTRLEEIKNMFGPRIVKHSNKNRFSASLMDALLG